MSSDRPVKCPYCNQYFRRSQEEFVHFRQRFWHKNCYNLQTGERNKEEQDRKELITYIEKLFNKKVDARILRQIKNFIEDYDYKYKGIQLTLEYFFELKGNSLAKSQGGIGIVPFVYEEAKNYHIMKNQVSESLDSLKEIPVIEKKITIKDPSKQKKYNINKTIDITGL